MSDFPTPQDDRAVRRRAHVAMTQMYYAMQDVIRRHYDEDGLYQEPTGVSDGGDNTGMIRAANNEVLQRLVDEVESTRVKLTAILQEIDDYKRNVYGPSFNPPPPSL